MEAQSNTNIQSDETNGRISTYISKPSTTVKLGKGAIYPNKLSYTNHQDKKKCINLINESQNEKPTIITTIQSTHGNKSSTTMNKSVPSNLKITNSKSKILQTSQTLYQKKKEFLEEMKNNLDDKNKVVPKVSGIVRTMVEQFQTPPIEISDDRNTVRQAITNCRKERTDESVNLIKKSQCYVTQPPDLERLKDLQLLRNSNKTQDIFLSSSSSSNSTCFTENDENDDKIFLIDDDYNDQQELTFCCQEDSLDESIFQQVDSLLLSNKETKGRFLEESKRSNISFALDAEYKIDYEYGAKLSDIKLKKAKSIDHGSLETLSSKEGFGRNICTHNQIQK